MRALSTRENLFVESYMETGDICKAAIAAGYSQKGAASSGNRVMARERVKERLRAFRAQIEAKYSYSREKMMGELEEVIKCAAAGDYPNYAAVLKAKEMQCKMLGYFEPEKQEINNFDVSISVLDGKPQEQPAESPALAALAELPGGE